METTGASGRQKEPIGAMRSQERQKMPGLVSESQGHSVGARGSHWEPEAITVTTGDGGTTGVIIMRL